ncbi:hypothetical protein KHA90_04060 [Flavobacterium psychroterrae]|uniref:Uncharacterized protein n=1 Tax=Flavobacterium psychroterrae TaxID=2133767 RepID=A0ABS5P799_9FLAO|nr:hypothetical protein [Flavobacterium psychroterrae]MBS7230190.1 hypothetical protein [Flavobacterium psychroterrae]
MALFTHVQLIAYIQRLELQKDILPLSPLFSHKQKEDLTIIYDQLLAICYETLIKEKEVTKPIYL